MERARLYIYFNIGNETLIKKTMVEAVQECVKISTYLASGEAS
jgi:hypothetical protein